MRRGRRVFAVWVASLGGRIALVWLALALAPAVAVGMDFGFAAVHCGAVDPHDREDTTNYTDEVAGWTTLNHVCIDSPEVTTARLNDTRGIFRAFLTVEPIFFEGGKRMRWNAHADALWEIYAAAIAASGARPVFYLADEPQLRRLDPALLSRAAKMITARFPWAEIAVIEAFHPDDPIVIPPEVHLWGFNAYLMADPAQDAGYMAHLARAQDALLPHQSLILVGDATHTKYHTRAGLAPADMADVARAYGRLAQATPRVAALLAYAWVGGIDWAHERGVRSMPAPVAQAWREVGRAVTAK